MTHELKKIVQGYQKAKESGIKSVLATVVALEGSSYRRPGVRMLILENGSMVGAVSGGCVEKEIVRQSESVFRTDIPKVMTYDGRYRLGCEGILYILIEPFQPEAEFLKVFWNTIKERKSFDVSSYFLGTNISQMGLGSRFVFPNNQFSLSPEVEPQNSLEVLTEQLQPCFRLIIVGAEHDAVQLCSFASMTGWEVTVVASPTEEKCIGDFPGADNFMAVSPEELTVDQIDGQTAIVLMTHSYVKDLKFLLALKDSTPIYLGLLGPSARREKLLSEFLEHAPEVSDLFFDLVHGPAGLNIGAETPQEIAISVLSEILAVIREQQPMPLKDKRGSVHS